MTLRPPFINQASRQIVVSMDCGFSGGCMAGFETARYTRIQDSVVRELAAALAGDAGSSGLVHAADNQPKASTKFSPAALCREGRSVWAGLRRG